MRHKVFREAKGRIERIAGASLTLNGLGDAVGLIVDAVAANASGIGRTQEVAEKGAVGCLEGSVSFQELSGDACGNLGGSLGWDGDAEEQKQGSKSHEDGREVNGTTTTTTGFASEAVVRSRRISNLNLGCLIKFKVGIGGAPLRPSATQAAPRRAYYFVLAIDHTEDTKGSKRLYLLELSS